MMMDFRHVQTFARNAALLFSLFTFAHGYFVCDGSLPSFDDSCYVFVTDEPLALATAKSKCEAMGAHLVFIETSAEQEFLVSELADLDPNGQGQYWIGVEKDQNGAQVWMDGTGTDSYNNFGQQMGDGGMCFRLRPSNYEWHDQGCSTEYAFICERKIECGENTLSFGDSCYLLVTDQTYDMPAARCTCESAGEHLVFIESSQEQVYLQSRLEVLDPNEIYQFWIGIEKNQDGNQVWMDGSAISYSNYGDDMADGGECFRLKSTQSYTWCDNACTTQYGFICEKNLHYPDVQVTDYSACPSTQEPTPTLTMSTMPSTAGGLAPRDTTFVRASKGNGRFVGGRCLINHSFKSVYASSPIECGMACASHAHCRSFNFDNGVCELNYVTISNGIPASDFARREGCFYYEPRVQHTGLM